MVSSEVRRPPNPDGESTSRIRDVVDGQVAWTSADIVSIGSGSQAEALRLLVEQHGVTTRLLGVGQARHLVQVLNGGVSLAPYVVLCCHGDDGIVLPILGEELEGQQPFHGRATAADIRAHARLDGQIVMATGCGTGSEDLAAAFLDAGASAYVAPTGAPYGYASVMAPALLFYALTQRKSLRQAVELVRRVDDHLSMWRLFASESAPDLP